MNIQLTRSLKAPPGFDPRTCQVIYPTRGAHPGSDDAVVLEVGLGGRLDATNVLKQPVVCGVTSLGMDHVEVLGDTLAKIAYEKAGIFKPVGLDTTFHVALYFAVKTRLD